jgi:serine/threonine-protein kinase
MQDLVGSTVGQYEIVEKLGRGGMANVYKAYHPGLAQHRALKVIRPDLSGGRGFEERFQLEARAVASLRHPNIVQMHDFGQHEEFFYMVMEFVDGEDLKARITREGPVRPFEEALRIAEELAAALGYAHGRGILHRDVKPDNVMLARDGSVILTDFGIAKIVGSQDPALTAAGSNIGTPAYMAPELATGQTVASPSADLYALGVVLYEMLTAQAPFAADTPLAVLHRVLHDPVRPPRELSADIPEGLQNLVLKAMAFEPTERFASADAFIEASKVCLPGVGPEAPPQLAAQTSAGGEAVARPSPPRRLNRGLLAAAALGLAGLVLLGVSVAWGWRWATAEDRFGAQALLGLAGRDAPASELASGLPLAEATQPLDGGDDSFFGPEGEEADAEGPGTAAAGQSPPAEQVARVTAPDGRGGEDGRPGGDRSPARAPERRTGAAQAAAPPSSLTAQPTPPIDAVEAARQARRQAGIQPLPAERFAGTLRFGSPVEGELDPEETVTYDIEIRRPTYIYFDIVYATRQAWYTLHDAEGREVFRQGSDLGPFKIEEAGWYTLSIETDATIPVSYEIEFRQVGS